MAVEIIKAFNKKDDFVFIPACCYAGNQFDVLKYPYGPKFTLEDAKIDMPITITDVPRLEKDGSGKIEVTTGDAATPCIGVYSPSEKRAILVFTVQHINGRNIGLAYERGEIRLTWPAKREKVYRICKLMDNPEKWEDKEATIPYEMLEFPCESVADFYRTFFENRKRMGLDSQRPMPLPFAEQFAIQRDKFNSMNWHETPEFYTTGVDWDIPSQVWQPGWVGGALNGYPLMKLGGSLECERQQKTLSFLFTVQSASGFFYDVVDKDGNAYSGQNNWHLLRKSADVLYFMFKHFRLMQERRMAIPTTFTEGIRKTADAFVRLFHRYGQFGQYVDMDTGDLRVGGSVGAAIACAGLAEAYRFFGDNTYLLVAKEGAELYYRNFLSEGYTVGGPGDILQCVDSESAFGLLESYVVLYDVTREEKWLNYAREAAHYGSSWVVSYNYQFPATSEFGRLNIKTVGSVFASIQNKHAAPGLCTLSGDSLYKLWQWTADPLYLELLKDIALTIGQYLSTDARPICDCYIDPSLPEAERKALIEEHRMRQGFINERVNMSDWEGESRVGGIFNGSCWSEAANLLTLAEVIPLLS